MQEAARTAVTTMGLYRLFRPLTVDAVQCIEAGTIATDFGFTDVKRGDWIICGEDGENYILDNEFFQRTFAPAEGVPGYGPGGSVEGLPGVSRTRDRFSSRQPARRQARGRRKIRLAQVGRKRNLRTMH